LDALHVADHRAVSRLERELVEMAEVEVPVLLFDDGDDAVVPVFPKVGSDVEGAPGLYNCL